MANSSLKNCKVAHFSILYHKLHLSWLVSHEEKFASFAQLVSGPFEPEQNQSYQTLTRASFNFSNILQANNEGTMASNILGVFLQNYIRKIKFIMNTFFHVLHFLPKFKPD